MSSVHRKHAGQVIVAGYTSAEAPDAVLDALRAGELAGVILFKRNVGCPPQELASRIAKIAAASPGLAPIVAVDQEGGRVQRLGPPILQLPPMRVLGERDDVELTRRCARALGRQLAALGFNVDFAPVLDVFTNPANEVIGDRAFGSDPERVARHARAFASGLADAGLLACGKHFPGHGDTVEDSHFALPALPHALDRLEKIELHPFRAAHDAMGSMMTAHIVFRALDPERPATLSRRVVTGLLREELGYRGVIVSDDLEMRAIADEWPAGEAAVLAIEAGCDLLLICKQTELAESAVRALSDRADRDGAFAARLADAAARVNATRAKLSCAPILDAGALERALDDADAAEVRAELLGQA
jgi:beta-N-acetylhexosaminidase